MLRRVAFFFAFTAHYRRVHRTHYRRVHRDGNFAGHDPRPTARQLTFILEIETGKVRSAEKIVSSLKGGALHSHDRTFRFGSFVMFRKRTRSSPPSSVSTTVAKRSNWWIRLAKRMAWACLTLVTALIVIVLIGFVPVNNDFVAVADDAPGVDIFLMSNSVHADIVVPLFLPDTDPSTQIDWRKIFPASDFPDAAKNKSHAAIGWGDQGFYIHTPQWSDLEAGVALKAMFWPSATCLHVDRVRPSELREKRRVRISYEQYAKLAKFINSSLQQDRDGNPIRIPDAGYTSTDAFYEATGTYWFLYTCNSWAGRAMCKAGIRTPCMTPLPKSMMLYLPESEPEIAIPSE